MRWSFTIGAWLLASVICFVIASTFHTQFVLFGLTELGVHISIWQRLQTVFVDMLGMLGSYAIVLSLGLAIAFSIASLVAKFVNIQAQRPRMLLFAIAGGFAVACILWSMQPILDITLLAGARSSFGFICQCIAGCIAGWVFANIMHTLPARLPIADTTASKE